jgi:hypothetical protein
MIKNDKEFEIYYHFKILRISTFNHLVVVLMVVHRLQQPQPLLLLLLLRLQQQNQIMVVMD